MQTVSVENLSFIIVYRYDKSGKIDRVNDTQIDMHFIKQTDKRK